MEKPEDVPILNRDEKMYSLKKFPLVNLGSAVLLTAATEALRLKNEAASKASQD